LVDEGFIEEDVSRSSLTEGGKAAPSRFHFGCVGVNGGMFSLSSVVDNCFGVLQNLPALRLWAWAVDLRFL
jgi:hypothetical protein